MPFQSEKQRRYLWANEPEIARDWTDTYGSGIAKALGGRIGLRGGQLVQPGSGRPGYGGPHETYGGGVEAGRSSGPSDRGPRDAPDRHGPVQTVTPTRSRIQNERQEDFRQKQMADLLAQQQTEKDYTRTGQIKPGPQLGFTGSGAGPNLGSMASQFAGSKIGGGLGSMLFGPWGALLFSMLGRGVGKRGWQASQTDEKETMKDILFGNPDTKSTLLSNLFNKKNTPTGEGLEGIDLSNMIDKFNPKDPGVVGIENKFAFKPNSSNDKRLRTLHNQKTEGLFWNEQNQKEYEQLLKEDAEQTDYPKSVIT